MTRMDHRKLGLKSVGKPLAATTPQRNGHVPIDTSSMNQEQQAAMEVAESAREPVDARSGFGAQLTMGSFRANMLEPFPMQAEVDRKVGDELVQRVSDVLSRQLDPDEVDETRTIPRDVIESLRDLGVFRMKVPREYGGLGVSQVNYNRVIQAIASHCGSTAVLVSAHQSIGVPQPVKLFGTEQQKRQYLPRISRGDLSAFALTEPDVGSDPARMRATAELSDDGSHYTLNGEKLWTTNGPIAQLLIVMAKTAPRIYRGRERPQITAFIVETDWPGVETVHRCDFMGLRAIHNGLLRFTDVKVPVENVLVGEGQGLKLALRTLNTGRLTLPAACAGMGKQCLSIVRDWSRQRVQWGQPIGKHEAGREKIAFIASSTFAMEAVTWLTSHWADEGRDIRIEAAMAKLFCSEIAWRVIDETMQLRGGRGYERATSLKQRGETPYPVERMMRDCRINRIIEGTTDIMHLFLAREALDPHLALAMPVMHPDTPPREKLRAGFRAAGFYAHWFPRQVVGSIFGNRLPLSYRAHARLAGHMRYIDRTAHRLAASLFAAMARYQQKLERKQVLLGHLMDIGTELFAMAATCAYARQVKKTDPEAKNAVHLADAFCHVARQRIDCHFRSMHSCGQSVSNNVAGRVLDGEFQWLEEGIVRIDAA